MDVYLINSGRCNFYEPDALREKLPPVLWQTLKVWVVWTLLIGLAQAISNGAPHELLLRLQRLVQQGDLEVARSQLDAAIKRFPSEPGLYNLLGVVEVQRGNRGAAEADFRKALRCAPDFTGALLNLGRLYLQRSSEDPKASGQALDAYEKVLLYEGNNQEALYQSAALLAASGSYHASLHHLDRLPTEIQERAQVLAVRCADQAGLNQSEQAAEIAERLLKSSDLTEADVVGILPQVEAHNEALATQMLEALLERHVAGREMLGRLGWHYEHQGKLPQAREVLEQAEQAGPPSVEVLSELARVAYQQHDLEGSLGYLAHARDLDPTNPRIHFFFGVVCIELNLPLDARKSLDEAVRLDPQNAYYNYALGSVALRGSDPTQAVPYFEKYVETKPEDPRGRFALGVAHFYSADYEAATKELRAVADKQETASGAHYFLGRIAKGKGNLPEAEIELKQAITADPQFADALAELGLVHIKLRRYDDARDELERAFTLEPDNFRVNANLLILYQTTEDSRASEQESRFKEIEKKRAEDERLLWRTIEVRPY